MRKTKPKTQQDLFIHILDLWLENEIQCISEWGVSDHEKLRAYAKKEYEEYLKLWEELGQIKERKND